MPAPQQLTSHTGRETGCTRRAHTGTEARYQVMIEWSEHHTFLPSIFTHPDLQLDYALFFALAMLCIWVAKDAADAIWCCAAGYFVASAFLGINVFMAINTGWDMTYVRFLPIFVWDTPANVIGVSPITMILDSVAVMLILEVDDRAYQTAVKSGFAAHVRRIEKYLDDTNARYASLSDAHELALTELKLEQ